MVSDPRGNPWDELARVTKITDQLACNIFYTVMPDDVSDFTQEEIEALVRRMFAVARQYH